MNLHFADSTRQYLTKREWVHYEDQNNCFTDRVVYFDQHPHCQHSHLRRRDGPGNNRNAWIFWNHEPHQHRSDAWCSLVLPRTYQKTGGTDLQLETPRASEFYSGVDINKQDSTLTRLRSESPRPRRGTRRDCSRDNNRRNYPRSSGSSRKHFLHSQGRG